MPIEVSGGTVVPAECGSEEKGKSVRERPLINGVVSDGMDGSSSTGSSQSGVCVNPTNTDVLAFPALSKLSKDANALSFVHSCCNLDSDTADVVTKVADVFGTPAAIDSKWTSGSKWTGFWLGARDEFTPSFLESSVGAAFGEMYKQRTIAQRNDE
jgi:hypothetical protein